MAALVLSAVGGAAGGAVFGPAGAIAGRLVGALAGSAIDRSLFSTSSHSERTAEGPRLSDLEVMASTEGAPVPRLYGRARLSGQVIWATALEELVTVTSETTTTGGGGGGGGGKGFGGGGAGGGTSVTTTTTTYSYFANLAVGLCEGPIGRVLRVWADGKPLDHSTVAMRVYPGDETQTVDPLIAAKEGAAPAYRGTAYAVFERLALEPFGNRVPQLSFEVLRPVGALEKMTRAVTLIPGTTEFGYAPATVTQVVGPGQFAPENRHVATAPSDIVASLDELQAVCPNLDRVAVVVAWFGDDLRAANCQIMPKVDSLVKTTHGAIWSVAGLARGGAQRVSTIDGRPAFGGTPSDESVRDLIANLKARGLKVTLYPFVMMDIAAGNGRTDPYTGAASQPVYPWRGRITCDPAPGIAGTADGTAAAATQLDAFFTGNVWNYRRMVLHYANLALQAGGIDAFVIGSELRGLTRVRSASGIYPGVAALASIAAEVKAIVGGATVVTYGADWTEYGAHVVDAAATEVRFPLDALWSSPAIDAVGIDYYAPLADWRDSAGHLDRALAQTIYDKDYLAGNLRRGEAYDWFYADDSARIAQMRSAITDGLGKPWIFRPKDLWSWWSQPHFERVGGAELATPTGWMPQGKPVWLVEIGCPAVDKGANQPSVFPDPKSSENFFPYFSNGRRDDLIQRRTLEAVLAALDPAFGASDVINPVSSVYGGRMFAPSAIHLWTWDARPYPVFPAAIDVWSDGPNWETGHWLTGRLGAAPLDALVGQLLADSGVTGVQTGGLRETTDGYVVDRPMPPRAAIDPLALIYGFDATEAGGALAFVQHGGEPVAEFVEDDLVLPPREAPLQMTRAQETELPREVSIGYTDSGGDYRRAAVLSRRLVGGAARQAHADVPVVTSDGAAARRADIWLQDLWAGRERAEFALPPSALAMTPGDVIGLTAQGRRRLYEIQEVADAAAREVRARSIDPEIFNLPLRAPQRNAPSIPAAIAPVSAQVLDLPAVDAAEPPVLTRLAVFADPWPGPVALWQSSDGLAFERAGLAMSRSTVGETLDALAAGPLHHWDRANMFRVRLYGGALASLAEEQVLAGGNAAAVRNADGDWEIIQFANAELVGEGVYLLSQFLRGRAGSDRAMTGPLAAGAPFVMLDGTLLPAARGLGSLERELQFRLIVAGRDYGDPATLSLNVTPRAVALTPLAPVHVRARRIADGIALSWIRRTRRDGDGWSGEVPLGEDIEAYEVDILYGQSPLRTLASATPAALYSAAAEFADFGVAQAHLTVAVHQLSATVGRGFPAIRTLTV